MTYIQVTAPGRLDRQSPIPLYYQLKEILRSPFVDHFCCRERPAGSGLLLTEPDVAVDDIVAILDLIFAGQE